MRPTTDLSFPFQSPVRGCLRPLLFGRDVVILLVEVAEMIERHLGNSDTILRFDIVGK